MSNIISAIMNLVKNPQIELTGKGSSHNRVNNVGVALEEYVKDLFAGTLDVQDEQIRSKSISATFSYLGNQNNPPDSMLLGGDAIEVKKIENKNSALALNSSYPKAKLYADSPMLKKECRECEAWSVKDIIYAVGITKGNKLESLAFIYGEDYCADKETYERIKTKIKSGVESIPNVEFSKTKELGHVNRVDPLGITYLRIRGMWGIEDPFTVFDYIYKRNENNKFNFMCIINKDKFNTFDNTDELFKLSIWDKKLSIKDVLIKNPNNPAQLKDAKLITFVIGDEQ